MLVEVFEKVSFDPYNFWITFELCSRWVPLQSELVMSNPLQITCLSSAAQQYVQLIFAVVSTVNYPK